MSTALVRADLCAAILTAVTPLTNAFTTQTVSMADTIYRAIIRAIPCVLALRTEKAITTDALAFIVIAGSMAS